MNRRRGRKVDGILLLDKPVGVTSNDVLQRIKSLFRARKAGHTGNLDKPASGLLPICFGEATKVCTFLLDAPKRYRASLRLGKSTTTGDATGEVIKQEPVPHLSQRRVEQVLRKFTGVIEQVPPMYSAIKRNGQPLHKLARQGIVVEREARCVTIYRLALLDFDGQTLAIEVECSKGTYIRTLAEDIGQALGCGAHVGELRRVGVAGYHIDDAFTVESLEERSRTGLESLDRLLAPMDSALADSPEVRLSEDAAYYVQNGQAVLVPHAPTEGLVRLYSKTLRFLGVGQVLDDGRIAPRRLVNL